MKKSDLYDHIYTGDLEAQLRSGQIVKPLPDYFQNEKTVKEALVVISNLIARAGTKWNTEEQKLFLYAVSQIDKIDDDCTITLNKQELITRLNIDEKNVGRLRDRFDKIRKKSDVHFTGPGADDWEDGNLIRYVQGTKHTIKIQFEERYLPLLLKVQKNFTSFYLEHILCLNRKAAISLYMFLTSWADTAEYPAHEAVLLRKDVPFVLGLSGDQYWRKDKATGEKIRFDWCSLERFCLKPAIEDINTQDECDLYISDWNKVKDKKNNYNVLGYEFTYSYKFKDGVPKWAPFAYEKYKADLEANRLGQADDLPYNLGAQDKPLK